MKKTNKQDGITLVALVITIVILLILAGITIAQLTGKGLFTKAQLAEEETLKQTATEKMNFKITEIEMASWAEKQRMPSLQELADKLCENESDEFEYVLTTSKKTGARLENIVVADSIFTKLKKYPYEFEINSDLQLASIDGVKVADQNSNNSFKSELIKNITFDVQEKTTHSVTVNINVDSINEDDARVYYVYVNDEVVTGNSSNTITVENLDIDTSYNIKCACIDKTGKIAESKEQEIKTEKTEFLYKEAKYSPLINKLEFFRVDTASSWQAYWEEDDSLLICAMNTDGIAGLNTEKEINFDNINYIDLDVGMYNSYGTSFIGTTYLGVSNKKDTSLDFAKVITYDNSSTTTSIERKILTLDVSEMTGNYYIKIIAQHPSNITYHGYYNRIYSLSIRK